MLVVRERRAGFIWILQNRFDIGDTDMRFTDACISISTISTIGYFFGISSQPSATSPLAALMHRGLQTTIKKMSVEMVKLQVQ